MRQVVLYQRRRNSRLRTPQWPTETSAKSSKMKRTWFDWSPLLLGAPVGVAEVGSACFGVAGDPADASVVPFGPGARASPIPEPAPNQKQGFTRAELPISPRFCAYLRIPAHADHRFRPCRSRFRCDRSERNSAVTVAG